MTIKHRTIRISVLAAICVGVSTAPDTALLSDAGDACVCISGAFACVLFCVSALVADSIRLWRPPIPMPTPNMTPASTISAITVKNTFSPFLDFFSGAVAGAV